jgi:hypothetical protein
VVLGGWEGAAVVTIQSGSALTISDTNANNVFGISEDRAQLSGTCSKSQLVKGGSVESKLGGYFNAACFTSPPIIGTEANGFALYETPAVRDRNTQSELQVDKGGGVDLVRDGLFGAGALAEPVRRGTWEGKRSALGQDALRRSLTNVPPSRTACIAAGSSLASDFNKYPAPMRSALSTISGAGF